MNSLQWVKLIALVQTENYSSALLFIVSRSHPSGVLKPEIPDAEHMVCASTSVATVFSKKLVTTVVRWDSCDKMMATLPCQAFAQSESTGQQEDGCHTQDTVESSLRY